MKYSYFIFLIILISVFVIFTNLNSDLIELDLFFAKISGFTKGFAIMVAILIGAIVSFFFQLPILIRKNRQINLSVFALEKAEEKEILKENISKNKQIESETKTSIGDLIQDEIEDSSKE